MTERELTKKIIKNAKQQADALIASAESQAQAKIVLAQQQAGERQQNELQKAKKALAEKQAQAERAQTVTLIKAQIDAKQALLDQAFDQVRDNWYHATPAQIKNLAQQLIQKYAQPGDTITVATDWASALPDYPTTTNLRHGLIIENNIYRWELTVDNLLTELREKIALPVAQILGVM